MSPALASAGAAGEPRPVKAQPPKNGLQLTRYDGLVEFTCARCGGRKKSKLRATVVGDANRHLCNGCYGWVLANPGGWQF